MKIFVELLYFKKIKIKFKFCSFICTLLLLSYLTVQVNAQVNPQDKVVVPSIKTVQTESNVAIPTSSPISIPNKNSISLNFIQSSSNYWYDGENNSLTLKLIARIVDKSKIDNFVLVNRVLLKLGTQYVKNQSNLYPWRISDNELSLESISVLNLGWTIDPYISLKANTSVTEIFLFDDETNDRFRIGKLLDPLTIRESAGLRFSDFSDNYDLDVRSGFYLEQIFSDEYTDLTDNLETPDITEKFALRRGIESISDLNASLTEIINYTGRIELSSQFRDLTQWKVKIGNEFRAKLWKFIYVSLNVNFVYNIEQNIHSQWQESLNLGITQNF